MRVERGCRCTAVLILYRDGKWRRIVHVTTQPPYAQLKTPVPIVEEAGLDPGLVWTGVENIRAPAGVRTLYHPTHGESLYRPLLFNAPK